MFRRILIANRGEIACRVIRTARRMGIATVAVYSDADAGALHVELADEARHVGPAAARDSYLRMDRVIAAARASGAEAIHPGYGFLSENAAFAEACAEAGIVFIGPPPSAIRAMGSKAASKALMERSGVPLVPGYHGADQAPGTLAGAAAEIGYPVLIKASAGGGGKGMRVVERADGFAAALDGARREAAASFGDDRVLVERYLTRPRHIEIQVFADTHGACVSLFERDCSIQRRHQKVIEEAPAPGMTEERRAAMGTAAVAAARAVGYVGAGTVEFISEHDRFYFMEMNTRLQVEHPVTEMITGLDLVEWQLRVAAGERLPDTALRIEGHAIEARIYAEDPARDFLPSIGTLLHLRQPDAADGVRVDTGVRQGDAITPYYDPMIAKLIVHGASRAAAVRRLGRALAGFEVGGVRTNLGLLHAIAGHAAFAAGGVDTGFIGDHAAALMPDGDADPPDDVWAAAAMRVLADWRGDAGSPWTIADGWQLNGLASWAVDLVCAGRPVTIRATGSRDGGFVLELPGGSTTASAHMDGDRMTLRVDGRTRPLTVVRAGDELTVIGEGRTDTIHVRDPLAPPAAAAALSERVIAPIPARVTRILVAAGDSVAKGAALIVLEAMKMELTLSAPRAGTVALVRAEVGDMVQEGTELIGFADAPA